MDNVLETIEIINQYTTNIYYDIIKMEGKDYYLKGGCLELNNILKKIYPDSTTFIRYDKSHIVTEINGILYDSNGIVLDKNNYEIANNNDIEYINNYSGNHFKPLRIGESIIKRLELNNECSKEK